MSTAPLQLSGDGEAVRVLLTVRSLLAHAERLSTSLDAVSRASTILIAQTAIETLTRCAWERLFHKSKDNATAGDIENFLYGELKPNLKERPKVKALRLCRNSVAHHGSIPSSEDTAVHSAAARKFADHFASVVWDCDLQRLSAVSLIVSKDWRELLSAAYSLLNDPGFVLDDRRGKRFERLGHRPTVAVGLARAVWDACNRNVGWPALRGAPELGDLPGDHDHQQQEEFKAHGERERALRTDLLALTLGVRHTDLQRFLSTSYTHVAMNGRGALILAGLLGKPAPEPEAAWAVEFVGDWVLRAQQHVQA